MEKLRIATRGSALALWQARHVRDALRAREPELEVDLLVIKTRGDKILDVPLAKVGGKGLFVKEIEHALVSGEADLAVHSMKDVPVELQEGLALVAVSAREDPVDVLCARERLTLAQLPAGAVVGTSSLRRAAQLRMLCPGVAIAPLRGNVDTRLRKLDSGDFDAIILAAAGLVRLGHGERICERLEPPRFLPAVAQGALGLEARVDDERTIARTRAALHCEEDARRVRAERAFLAQLGGSCQTPIAGHAVGVGADLLLSGLVARTDGSEVIRGDARGAAEEPEALGRELADDLLGRGAAEILSNCEAEE